MKKGFPLQLKVETLEKGKNPFLIGFVCKLKISMKSTPTFIHTRNRTTRPASKFLPLIMQVMPTDPSYSQCLPCMCEHMGQNKKQMNSSLAPSK